jgi:flagellar basal-body rod protein FlgB
MSLFTNTNIPLLNRALGAYSLRQKVIGTNVANLTTTGYHAKSVTFGEELKSAMHEQSVSMTQTDPNHMTLPGDDGSGNGCMVVEERTQEGADGDSQASGYNDVNIDHEMSELAKNQIRYKYAARFLSESFKALQKSIRGTI